MFEILVAVLILSIGETHSFKSKETFPTMEACEAVRGTRTLALVMSLGQQIPLDSFELRSVCKDAGRPA
jgi:hypothetical protein